MTYVDGVIAAVPTADKQAYLDHARKAAALFKELGALSVTECWGDDVPEGKTNSLHTAVLRKPEETVVFSWITWPSKAVRDEAWQKLHDDPSMGEKMGPMPFDGQRMIFGGFEAILEH
jgi:uncharacterized protein YbaA (DUF1428 family)